MIERPDDGLTVRRPGDPNGYEHRVEFATARGGTSSPFPLTWGPPPGRDGQDPERRQWILDHLGGEIAQRSRQLARRDAALVVALRRAELLARK
jgi:hypothetical protein